MSESFLHYLWQFQYFDKSALTTTDGEPIHVYHTGYLNTHAGPDFFNARVRIGTMEWGGSVEIHINASGWYEHNHDVDRAYENVVLHVVWKNDKPVKRNDNSVLPTLELKNKVAEKILLNYKQLVNSPAKIPCSSAFSLINDMVKISMLDKALYQRLEHKSKQVLEMHQRNNGDWNETCYQLISKNFGFKVNEQPFLQLALTLPYKLLLKHADQVVQVEAMLYGHSGFLEEFHADEYMELLQREYNLLCQKYQLHDKRLAKTQWRFLRLRPANFPTIRLAQLAMLLHQQKNIFSKIIEANSIDVIRNLFAAQQSDYWQHHFRFGKKSSGIIAPVGESSIDAVIINTVVPLLAAYAQAKDEQLYLDRAVEILQQLHAENNTITRVWSSLGFQAKTAFDSQAQIELYNNFCTARKCLACNIGASLVKPVAK